MKRIVKIMGILVILLALLISSVYAAELEVDVNEETLNLLSSSIKTLGTETINTDVFLAEENILLQNDVNGNVYAVGTIVNISSKNIDGDIFVIGEEVIIDSNVTGNIYAIANNFNVSGNLKDAFVLAEMVNLNENVNCRDFKIIGTNTNLAGNVNRDLYAVSGDVNISNTGKVGGILSTVSDVIGNVDNANEIQIIEDIFANFENTEVQIDEFAEKAVKTLGVFFFITSEVTGLLIIALIVLFTSRKQINISELKEHGLKDTLYGLAYFCIAILLIIGLVFTIIGIPVSILLCIILWFIFWKITLPVASIQIAKAILKQENKSKFVVWLLAFVIFTLVQIIAGLNAFLGIIKTIISLYGFGYMIRSIIRKNKTEEVQQVEIL